MGDGPEYRWDRHEKLPVKMTELTYKILHELSEEPFAADELASRIDHGTDAIERRLRQLEFAGIVYPEKGKWYHLMTNPEDRAKLRAAHRLIANADKIGRAKVT